MTEMHNHPDKTASYIMFEDEDCPYCRIAELEKQLAEQGICEMCKDKSVLAADKYREQNAKLVEALETLSKLGNGDKVGNSIGNQIAIAALKEMEVGNDKTQKRD